MKKIDIIYSIIEQLNDLSDDNNFSEEFIADQIDIYRNKLVKQTLRNSGDVSEDFIQSLDEVYMDMGDASISPKHDTDINILISDTTIPKPLRVKQKDYLTRIGPLNIFEPSYNIITIDRLPYIGKGKFNNTQKFACYYNNKILIAANKVLLEFIMIQYISVRGIFANPDEVVLYNSNTTVHHNWDYEYPMPDTMIDDLIKMVLQSFTLKLQLPTDRDNDATAK